jgi:hypothetical protein
VLEPVYGSKHQRTIVDTPKRRQYNKRPDSKKDNKIFSPSKEKLRLKGAEKRLLNMP